ncbi:hypothetical protein [Leifsonia sp. EB34]|uniref:hypothetical protein n=1 Tax=Leifsonia sp. EB34 TaxID=3156303 RepID=UPI0035161D39
MGVLEIDRVRYSIDSNVLACLPEVLTALLGAHKSIEIVLAFSDADIPLRVRSDSPLSIEIESGVDSDEDGAGLLLSEFMMMGRLRLGSLGAAPDAAG